MEFSHPNRSSSKWRRYAADVLPMHVAEMDFEVAPEIQQLLQDMVQRSDLGYLGPIPELADGFAHFAKSRWNWEIAKPQLKLATDVGVAAVELLRVLTKPGDKVLVNFPVYSSFRGWISEVGCSPHDVPLIRDGETWRLDLAGIEQAFQSGIKVYLLCSPQNPVGRIHSREELTEVARLAKQYQAVVISDEIHAPLSWGEFVPFLALGEAAREVGVTITSSSKAWNTAGLKAAFLLTQSPRMQELIKALPDSLHWRASLLGAFAMTTSFKDATEWLDKTVSEIEANYHFLESELAKVLPKARIAKMEATYLAWIDLSEYPSQNLATELMRVGRVAVVAGEDHGGEEKYQKFIRLNFATSKERISEALRRIALTLQG
jgi:cysteine-S-conjugate beta-lyase